MIEMAKKNLSRKNVKATLQWANVEKLPFPDNHFDTIVDGIAKSPSVDFLLTETEKCDFRFPHKSTDCVAPH